MLLKILSWNSQSVQFKDIELSHFLQQNFFHIVCIQETWLKPNLKFSIPGYHCLRQDRISSSPNPHGGVAILVHSSIKSKCTRAKFVKMDLVESIFVEISLSTFKFTLGSIYCPGKPRKYDSEFEKKIKLDLSKLLSRPGPFVLTGDWNAKHINWNNKLNDQRGNFLDSFTFTFTGSEPVSEPWPIPGNA
jgi:exonuclease III